MTFQTSRLFSQCLAFGSAFALTAFSAAALSSTSVTPPPVLLAHTPLHSTGTMDKPTMTLALSVEFPTIGALYRDGNLNTDASYSHTNEYLGYFYSKGCYQYLTAPTDTPETGEQVDQYKRFQFVSESSDRQCSGEQFSGNFLNWAASSSIDILRLALSGGDRYIDKDGLTILQRAVVPAGTPRAACLWNHRTFFPAKKLAKSKFTGAIPATLATAAGNNDLWIASRNDGIYFNRYASNQSPVIRDWDDSSNACKISTEVSQYQNFLRTAQPQVSEGFYYARVEVCTQSHDGSVKDYQDFDLCTLQPNGKFKPTGVIQKHANDLRIAALGYTLDHSSSRYGGVLRAPMRYVGAKSFDIHGREEATPNPYAEWDAYTGILHTNPYANLDDNLASWPSGEKHSGVINYLNKFGRLGTVTATAPTTDSDENHYFGEYKRNDPISSLYHQSLRYLQGLPNIPDASSNLKNKHYDGFPIYRDWSSIDPFGNGRSHGEDYACLKNNVIVIGDIFSQENSGWKTLSSDDTSRRAIDFNSWRKKALDYESAYFNTSLSPNDRHKIIGYAYWAHANDIRGTDWTEAPTKQRPGLRLKTFVFDVNEKGDSSLLSTRRKTNQFYLAAKYGGYETDPDNKDKNFYAVTDPNDPDHYNPHRGYDPADTNPTKTKVTTHAVWERRPASEKYATNKLYDAATYYLQSDARSVLSAFDEIFDRAADAAQSIAQSAANTSTISATTDSLVFTGTYDMASWTGDIKAEEIRVDATSKNISLHKDSTFSPATQLNLRASDTRNIVVGLGGLQGAASFTWSAIRDTEVGAHLSKASVSADPDDLGEARLNYLRGARTDEGSRFRSRTSLLGDIIHAGTSYSGAPTGRHSDSSYQAFLQRYGKQKTVEDGKLLETDQRLPIVITGANDGMLHAFAAQRWSQSIPAGHEVFAYIPSWLTPKLTSLADPHYVNNHQAFVDAPSAIGDAQLSFTSGSADDWKTVLVSGSGAGGRGVFALDITDPEQFSAAHVLWEFTHHDDSDLGHVVSKPQILKFKTDTDTYRWFAVVASGVNNYASDFEPHAGSATPSLFLLALDKPHNQAWEAQTNYFKISFPLDATLANTQAPGLIDFTPLWAKDGAVSHLYAGDLHGNVWKLDFLASGTTSQFQPTSEWKTYTLSPFKNERTQQALPLYRAERQVGSQTVRQPISAAPLLVKGPIVQGKQSFYVAFGTGKYLENSDTHHIQSESFYVLFDNGQPLTEQEHSNRLSVIAPGRSDLQAATLDSSTKTITVPSFIWGRPANNDPSAPQKSGWYFDFASNSERVIYQATHTGGFNIAVNSLLPSQNAAAHSICAADNASSHMYTLNIASGGRYRVSTVGILGPSLFLLNEDKTSTGPFDSTGRAKRTVVQEEITSGSTGNDSHSSSSTEYVGRLSWRQIHGYNKLKAGLASPVHPESPSEAP